MNLLLGKGKYIGVKRTEIEKFLSFVKDFGFDDLVTYESVYN